MEEFRRLPPLPSSSPHLPEAVLRGWRASAPLIDVGDGPTPGRDGPSSPQPSSSSPPSFSRVLLSGAVAGSISRTATAPVDRVKTLLQAKASLGGEQVTSIRQAFRLIYAESGLRGFWRGNGVNCLKIAPENATKFLVYNAAKSKLLPSNREPRLYERFFCGALAGVCSSVAIYPMEVLKTRLAVSPESYTGIGQGFVKIVRDEGGRGLFRGIAPSLLGVIPYAGVDLALYFTLRAEYVRRWPAGGDPPPMAVLTMGAVSSLAGQTVAYPLQLARTRLQLLGSPYTSTAQVWKAAVKADGLTGLWRGITPNFAKAVPAVSLSYLAFETVMARTKNWK